MNVFYVFIVVIWNGSYEEEYPQEYGLTEEDCRWNVQTYHGDGFGICRVDYYETEYGND